MGNFLSNRTMKKFCSVFIATLSLATLLFLLPCRIQAETPIRPIPIVNFDQLKPMLHLDNDSIYVINFWATWCAPCVREIPAFEKLYEQFKDQKVQVILVSLDFPNHLESRVIPFVQRMNVQSRVILLDDPDANRWIPLVSDQWTGAIPATLIYSRDTRKFYQREFYFEELKEIILPMLNQN